MPGPFPGMDPYLEDPGWWSDFHADIIPEARAALLDRLPEHYDVRIEMVTQLVELTFEEVKTLEPDLYAAIRRLQPRATARKPARKSARTATLEPVTLPKRVVREARMRRLRVLRRPGDGRSTGITAGSAARGQPPNTR